LSRKVATIITATFILILIAATAHAQFNWVTANQGTFQWDAVTVDGDGDPFLPGTHVEYTSYYVNSLADPTKANPIVVERTTVIQSTVTFPGKGRYWVGVTAHLVDDGSGEILETSEFAWSDVPENCENGVTFGFQLFATMPTPGGMGIPTP
jgi:hypothetical protein